MLKLKANYVSWGWDFDTNWNILETECYPYKKYQAAPPVIGSELVSQATEISGSSLDGGTVYLFYKDNDVQSTTCTGNSWSFTTEALQSGALVQLYSEKDGLTPSYLTSAIVKYPGSGTEEDPYRIYTAADLQGASNSGYYKLMNDMGTEVVYNHADYRLVSSRVLQAFSDYHEVNLFLRGMFPLVGFKSTSVFYARHERIAGESHYPLSKMLGLALDGITSMSTKPIRLITGFGCLVALISFIGVIWSIAAHFMGAAVAGWSSMVCILCFLGGIQLLGIGVIGEYVGKTYMETKKRPRYIISEKTWDDPDKKDMLIG
jgi:hypothetical protein